MNTYNSYKYSGQQWLGEIPEHWEMIAGKSLFKENKKKNSNNRETCVLSLSYGKIIVKKDKNEGLVPENYSAYQIVDPGNIIIRCTDLQNDKVSLRTGYVNDHGIISGAYLGLIPSTSNDSRFLHLLLYNWDITKELYRYGTGLRQSLSWNDLKYLRLPIPPLQEQKKIVEYVDSLTTQIDRAIAQSQRMIDLLNERKQIIIQHAVTHGLDSNPDLVDSGVEWIGKVPRGWRVMKLKFICSCNQETLSENTNRNKVIEYVEISDVNESNGIVRTQEYLFKDAPSRARRITQKGDVIISTVRTYLKAVSDVPRDNLIVSTGFAVLRAERSISPDFLNISLKSEYLKNQIIRNSTGISYPAITSIDLADLKIAVPSTEEQLSIVSYVNKKSEIINELIKNENHKIALLRERKQIIINEVVTGKVKVS